MLGFRCCIRKVKYLCDINVLHDIRGDMKRDYETEERAAIYEFEAGMTRQDRSEATYPARDCSQSGLEDNR